MCKKLGVTALAVVAALFVLNRLDLLGYGKLAVQKMKSEVRSQIPPEVKIERLKQEIAQLVPDMKKHREAFAAEQVEIEKLKRQIAVTKANLKEREAEILTMRKELEDPNKAFVTFTGHQFPRAKVEARLASDWESFKQAEAHLKSQEDLFQARLENLDLAKQKLAEMKNKKEQLELKVAQLETDLRNLRLAQTKSEFKIDDSQLARCQGLLQEIEDRIAQEKTELELNKAEFANDLVIPVKKHVQTENALKEIDARFGDKVAAGRK